MSIKKNFAAAVGSISGKFKAHLGLKFPLSLTTPQAYEAPLGRQYSFVYTYYRPTASPEKLQKYNNQSMARVRKFHAVAYWNRHKEKPKSCLASRAYPTRRRLSPSTAAFRLRRWVCRQPRSITLPLSFPLNRHHPACLPSMCRRRRESFLPSYVTFRKPCACHSSLSSLFICPCRQ